MMPHFILIYETCIRGKKCHESAFYRRLSVIGLQNHVGLFDTEKGRLQLTIPEDTFGLQGRVENHDKQWKAMRRLWQASAEYT